MSGETDVVPGLSAGELEAVSQVWKRERRTIVTTFRGSSMLPNIVPGQQVEFECGSAPRIGDVIVFLRGNQIGVHRVVALCRDMLVTWGDANPLPDEPVEFARVLGTVRKIPVGPASPYRSMLLFWLGGNSGDPERLRQRLRLAYRLRTALAAGPASLARKVARMLSLRLRP